MWRRGSIAPELCACTAAPHIYLTCRCFSTLSRRRMAVSYITDMCYSHSSTLTGDIVLNRFECSLTRNKRILWWLCVHTAQTSTACAVEFKQTRDQSNLATGRIAAAAQPVDRKTQMSPPKSVPSRYDLDSIWTNTWFLGATRVCSPNGMFVGSVVTRSSQMTLWRTCLLSSRIISQKRHILWFAITSTFEQI